MSALIVPTLGVTPRLPHGPAEPSGGRTEHLPIGQRQRRVEDDDVDVVLGAEVSRVHVAGEARPRLEEEGLLDL